MSFMDKITSRPRDARADTAAFDSQFDDVVTAYPEAPARDTQSLRAAPTQAPDTRAGYESQRLVDHLRGHAVGDGGRLQRNPRAGRRRPTSRPQGTALPLIGHLPAAAAAARAASAWSAPACWAWPCRRCWR